MCLPITDLMATSSHLSPTEEGKATHPDRIDIKRWMRLTAWTFMVSLLIAGMIGWPLIRNFETGRLNVIAAQQQGHLMAAKSLFEREITECFGDLKVLAGSPSLHLFLDTPTPARLERVQQLFLSSAEGYRRYDQIRFLDTEGKETVRVNFNQGKPSVVPSWALQSKADRSYFKQAISLPNGGVYISGITPNIELGIVEIPLKPMIRVATPVFTSSGAKAGVLVLNFLAERLQQGLSKVIMDDAMSVPMVLNETGYWVSHPDSSKIFNDLLAPPSVQRFSDQYPAEWAVMLNKSEGQITTVNGLFFYTLIDPRQLVAIMHADNTSHAEGIPTIRSDEAMYLTFHVPSKTLAVDAVLSKPWHWSMVGLLTLLLFVMSLGGTFMVVFREAQMATAQRFSQLMAKVAQVDELTGIANRRHFRDLAQRELNRVARVHEPLMALMLDIDFFKRINDQHGHKAGDDVLRTFSRVCEAQLRKTDVFGRLGGEEFAVLMPNTALGTAAVVAERLRSAVQSMKVTADGGAEISLTVSIGMAPFKFDKDSLDELLIRADAALYQAKVQGRNRVLAHTELVAVPHGRLSA